MYRELAIRLTCGRRAELLGEPNKAKKLWTIREVFAHFPKGGPISYSEGPVANITVAWYGVGATR
jgi:hypothetical protein